MPSEATQAVVHHADERRRAGKQHLGQVGGKQLGAARAAQRAEAAARQHFVQMLLGRGSGRAQRGNPAFGEVALQLLAHIVLEAAHDQPLMGKVLAGVVRRISNGRWIEHIHQAGEALWLAIVRRGGQHDERVRATRQQIGQAGALRATAALGHVVRLIDDDDVPVGTLQIMPVFDVLLERVYGHDGAIEIMEGVVIARNAVAHTLQALGIQPREDDSFQGLAQANAVGNENARPGLLQRLDRRLQLEGDDVHRRAGSSTRISGSMVVQNRASRPLTSSDRPSQVSSLPCPPT